jgi:hypothetical protein
MSIHRRDTRGKHARALAVITAVGSTLAAPNIPVVAQIGAGSFCAKAGAQSKATSAAARSGVFSVIQVIAYGGPGVSGATVCSVPRQRAGAEGLRSAADGWALKELREQYRPSPRVPRGGGTVDL